MNILTCDKLKEITSISKGLDCSLIEPFISIAEEFHIKPILGDELYEVILNKIELNELEDEYLILVNKYLNFAISYYAWYEASPHLLMRTEAKGIVIKNSEQSDGITTSMLKEYRQSILDKAIMYKNSLKKFLIKNKNVIIEYTDYSDNYTNKSSQGFFLGF